MASTAEAKRTTIDLRIGGMTCAACAARIERTLNKVDGVSATVNYALASARVEGPVSLDPATLIAVVEGAGYEARLPPLDGAPISPENSGVDALGRRVGMVALLGVPVILLGMVPAWQFTHWQWVALVLTFPIATWGAWPFHRAAAVNLRHATATMDTLVSVGVTVAFTWSAWVVVFNGDEESSMHNGFSFTANRAHAASAVYFEVVAAITLFLLAGRWFEGRARRRGGDALRALAELGAHDVARIGVLGEERVPVEALVVGDHFVVRPGEKIATDGRVVEGAAAIDAALVTGESIPVEVTVGDAVTGATLNAGGRLVVEVTRVGADTTLARMAKLVADAQSGKAPVQRLADRVAAVFVPVVILISIATLGYWCARGDSVAAAMVPAVAVLIVACPCALGLATPMALLVGTGRGAQIGVLIAGPEILEATRRVDTVVLDKTGTVTTGRMTLVEVVVADGVDADWALTLAASLEAASEHPIARVIAAAVPGDRREPVSDFESATGLGVSGVVAGRSVAAGRLSHLTGAGYRLPARLLEVHERAEQQGRTAVAVAWDGEVGLIAVVADTVRPSSRRAIAALGALGLDPVLVTGDHWLAAQAVAGEVGIERVVAGVLPQGKVVEVRRLQAEGRVVAVVGDGVNDAAALAQADLGLAMGSGTDAAMAAADLTLVRADLDAAVDAIRLSRRTLRTIKVNLGWAFGYNFALIPLAAAGLLNPMLAGFAMAASSVLVVANSLRLFRFQPTPAEDAPRPSLF